MTSFRLARHMRFEIRNREYEVRRAVDGDAIQFEAMDDGAIITLDRGELLDLVGEGMARSLRAADDESSDNFVDMTALPEDERVSAMRALSYVKAVRKKPKPGRIKSQFKNAIKKQAQRLGDEEPPHWKTVYRWEKEYIASGKDIRSLIDRSKHRGPKGSTLSPEVVAIIHRTIDEFYLTQKRPRVSDIMDFVEQGIEQLNLGKPVAQKHAVPSYRTILRFIKKIPKYEELEGRYGKNIAVRETRSIGQGPLSTRPLERVEVDHTRLDIIVCDDVYGVPLGRPNLTMIIDHYTRMPVGYYVGFLPPSALTIMLALRMAVAPKTWVKEKYPSIESDWPCHGVPETIVTDNGREFHSKDFEAACFHFGINVQHNRVREPWGKGVVERFFGEVNRSLIGGLLGKTFESISAKSENDPLRDATMSFSTFQEALCRWIVDYHAQVPHSGIVDIPAHRWSTGVKRYPIKIYGTGDDLNVFLPFARTQRQISQMGIVYKHIWYNSPRLTELRNSLEDGAKVAIKVNPENLGSILVIDDRSGAYFSVPALDFEYADGLGLWQHKLIIKVLQKFHYERDDVAKRRRVRREIWAMADRTVKNGKRSTTRGRAARILEVPTGNAASDKNSIDFGRELGNLSTPLSPELSDDDYDDLYGLNDAFSDQYEDDELVSYDMRDVRNASSDPNDPL